MCIYIYIFKTGEGYQAEGVHGGLQLHLAVVAGAVRKASLGAAVAGSEGRWEVEAFVHTIVL